MDKKRSKIVANWDLEELKKEDTEHLSQPSFMTIV